MKQYPFLTLVLLLVTTSLHAQVEFAPIGARWYQNREIIEYNGVYLQDYYIIESTGDTIINGLSYRQVGEYLFHQQGEEIYYLWQDTLRLIYKYDVEVGDTVTFDLLTCGLSPVVEAVTFRISDVSTVEGTDLKRIDCEWLDGYLSEALQPYYYMEKIGARRKLIEDQANCEFITTYVPEFLRCYSDSDIEYQSEFFLSLGGADCTVQMLPNGIDDQHLAGINIYPNPVADLLTVEVPDDFRGTLEIIDAVGRLLLTETVVHGLNISTGHLPEGVYFLKVKAQKTHVYTQKLIKQ